VIPSRKSYKWFYDNVQSHYYDLAMKWCYFPFGGEGRCRLRLIEPIGFGREDKILDMCCGTGGATFPVAEKAGEEAEITGMDLSRGQLRIAQRRANRLGTRKDHFKNLKFIEGHFDRVLITHALHEMRREERLKALKEAKRVLRDGGKVTILELDHPKNPFVRLFVGFWFFYWLPFNFETQTRRDMLRCGLENELEEVGFGNIRKISSHQGVFQVVEGEK
jgi:ubiquinone/menaquinone biosynthesis C-methylase UbiE